MHLFENLRSGLVTSEPTENEHLWRLSQVLLEDDGSYCEYTCELCGALLVVPPMGNHPGTV